MRVLQVHTRYRQWGGEDSVVDNERDLLSRAGHEVRIFEVSNPGDAVSSAATLAKAPWNRKAAKTVVAAAEDFQADIVHVHNTWFALSPAVFRALRKADFPTVATIHNYRLSCVNAQFYRVGQVCEDCLGRVPWRGVTRACYRDSRAQSAVVAVTIGVGRAARVWHEDVSATVALTQFAASKLIAGGVPAERVVVKPNTIPDPGERDSPPSASSEALFVGRLVEEKGVLDLVEAWSSIQGDTLQLTIVGDGPLHAALGETATEGIDLLGARDRQEVTRRMLEARALVLPSRWFEGLPMVLLEAMAAGLPVVVPDHGAMAEAAADGALVYEGSNVDSLRQALEALRSDERVDALGRRSRARYVDRFSDQVGLQALVDLYHRVLRQHEGVCRPR